MIDHNSILKRQKPQAGIISSSQLIVLAFATVFFSRTLELLGAPASINFFHFVTVPIACGVAIYSCRSTNKQQLAVIHSLLTGLFFLLVVILASALLNSAGFVNVLIDFMLLGEPFLLLAAIVSLSLSEQSFSRFRKYLFSFFFIHLLSIYIQRYVLRVDTWEWLGMVSWDRIQGVFLLSGAGHVVGASVSMSFSLYFFFLAKKYPLWLRIAVVMAGVGNVLIADAKQVFLAFAVAGILLFLTQINNITRVIQYLIAGILIFFIFVWCLENLEAFRAFNHWINPELYGPDGDATLLKTATFKIIPTHYHSIFNWFLGLGPGHTVGRLGGWMFRDYSDLLLPLGATPHVASREVWQYVGSIYNGSRTSMFSPLFGWAGIWGDLGFIGLFAYINLSTIVWSNFCKNNICKFLVLTVLIFGMIFSQIEEPGYMLSISAMIGLQYQQELIRKS